MRTPVLRCVSLLLSIALLTAGVRIAPASAVASDTPSQFSNSAGIYISEPGGGASPPAPASPYPSTILVSGLSGQISRVTVRLINIGHTYPDDIDVLLVGPTGQSIVLLSDVGGSPDVSIVTLTFDDDATAYLPNDGVLSSGTFRPTNVGSGDPFSAPAPVPGSAQRLSVFNGTDPNGAWSLHVVDDTSGDTGSIDAGWELLITTASAPTSTPTMAATPKFVDPAAITIPEDDTGAPTGLPSLPYPSTLSVAGVGGLITRVKVKLININHTSPDDIDVLLVSPAGQRVMLMSDVGGAYDATDVTITFDDAALSSLPADDPIFSGTFKPTNIGSTDSLPAPAPGLATGSTLAAFNGTDPNGTWSLYVVDDDSGDTGLIAGGWELTIITTAIEATASATSTSTPTPTFTATVTPTATATPTVTPTATITPEVACAAPTVAIKKPKAGAQKKRTVSFSAKVKTAKPCRVVSVRWDFGDPTTASDTASKASATYTYPTSGTYTATLTVVDNGGHVVSLTRSVSVP